MRCRKCGQMIADDAVFCGFCGVGVTKETSASGFFHAPSSLTDNMEPSSIPCYTEPPQTSQYNAYAPFPQSSAYYLYEKTTGYHRLRKKTWIIAAVALLLVVAAVVLVLVLTSGGPLDDISDAFGNNLEAGSFTAKMKVYSNGSLLGSYKIGAEYDMEDGDMTVVLSSDGDLVYAIYKGYSIVVREDYYGDAYVYKTDISDELDEIFEYCKWLESADLDDLDLEELLDEFDLPSDVRRSIRKYVDLDEAQEAFDTVADWLNDEDWLEENLGFEISEKNGVTTYTFEIDGRGLRDVMRGILKEFKPALDDNLYDDLEDEFGDIDRDMELFFEFCVKGDYVTSIEFSYDDGYDENSVVIEFDYIGSTEIDTDNLSYYLKRAEEWD